MTKWVVEEVSISRKQYVVESYTEDGALSIYNKTEPVDEEHISDSVFSIHAINLYEYQQTYGNKRQKDWVGSSMILNPR